MTQINNEAKNKSWFNNTVFVFCADHWSQPNDLHDPIDPEKSFRIPLFIYDPQNPVKKIHSSPVSQLDIDLANATAYRELRDMGIELRDAEQPVGTLSGGERRRLEITRALATNPSFMLLDEPFAGIDPIAVADIQQIIIRLKEKGIGILITDHNVQETLSITDRAYIINAGSILEAGPPEVIVKSETARAVYLGEQFKLS